MTSQDLFWAHNHVSCHHRCAYSHISSPAWCDSFRSRCRPQRAVRWAAASPLQGRSQCSPWQQEPDTHSHTVVQHLINSFICMLHKQISLNGCVIQSVPLRTWVGVWPTKPAGSTEKPQSPLSTNSNQLLTVQFVSTRVILGISHPERTRLLVLTEPATDEDGSRKFNSGISDWKNNTHTELKR